MPTNEQRRQAAKRKLERQRARRAERAKRRRTIAVVSGAATVVVIVGVVVAVTLLTGGDDQPTEAANQGVDIPTEPVPKPTRPQPLPANVDCQYAAGGQAAKPIDPPRAGQTPTAGTVDVTMQTTAGNIPLTLDRSLAPCTVNSFLSLAEQHFYTDTPCHRLSTQPGLQMLQCGDPTGQGNGGPGYTVPDEVFEGLRYGRGLVAMANTGQPNSGGSQFFLIYGNTELPPQYTVFATIGQEGLETLDRVAQAGDDGSLNPQPGGGKPNQNVTIQQVSRVE